MSVQVAEYLGIRTDSTSPIVAIPANKALFQRPKGIPCPFREGSCSKLTSGNKPVCAVRDKSTNKIWITCEHRLCATQPKSAPPNAHQKNILMQVAKKIFDEITEDDLLIKKEVPIPVTTEKNYKADYVLWRLNPKKTAPVNFESAVILEMQGGGETTNTGVLTRHITEWEKRGGMDNAFLRLFMRGVSTLETNAWRRQQEQFLIKGNVAKMTGGKIVFCVGALIYDYLMERFKENILTDLKKANWTLALIVFDEKKDDTSDSIKFEIDDSKTLFTDYDTFVQVLTNQSMPNQKIFTGEFMDLSGKLHTIG
jgi:hypothetical protein